LLARSVASLVLAVAIVTVASASAAPADNVRLRVKWDLSADQVKGNCLRQIDVANTRVNALMRSRIAPTADTILVPLENITADLGDRTVAETFLFSVSPSSAVRDASQACSDSINAWVTEFNARPDIYRALVAINTNHTATSPYQTKLLEFYLETFRRSGAGLDMAARKKFVALSQQLGRLQNKFSANLANDKSTVTITQDQAAGLSTDFMAQFTKNADGTFTVPVNESTVTPFLRTASDPTARKLYYVAYARRGGKTNVALLEQAISIRYQLAHLLGYKDWATYQLANKMARSPERVINFLTDLDKRLLTGANADLATLGQLKASETGTSDTTINPWDYNFYDGKLRKAKYSLNPDEIEAYFPVQHVVDTVLAIYSKMLGVTFTKGADDGWLPATQVFHYRVSDTATGRFIGDSYFDVYPRPGKYDHFANFPLLPNRVLPDGRTQAPLSVIVGNWPVAAPGKPALLSHDDVETFFHEFGHNMAAMLATAPYETLSGGFRQDFIEAPSQMLENWVWQPSIIKQLSSRYDTGAPMPDDLIQKLIASRYVDQSYDYTRQAFYALVDMKYHTLGQHVDTTQVWAELLPKTTPSTFVPGTYPQAGFGHLMGGYDAGYYGYLWSKVYAQDMFTRFQRQGLESPIAGAAYREDILAPAQTYEPDQEVTKFLGRPMSPDAFYAALGLKPTAQH
jgi:thimet oligopeptidase